MWPHVSQESPVFSLLLYFSCLNEVLYSSLPSPHQEGIQLFSTHPREHKDTFYRGLHIPAVTKTFMEVSSSGSTVTGCARYQHIDFVRKLTRLQGRNTVLSLGINAEMKPSLDSDEEIGTYQKKLIGDE
ncbi:hypothetical protein AMELA_G00048850 [Ameiurus melas]|uniref:Uncharacterized protein n=1 Tax=Ameiurus melas TaxID=219545 RepID=A0A7J6B4Y5_AMEME|nr:hypothetical protein AMELA_G00048850 [Ameiurus melas]